MVGLESSHKILLEHLPRLHARASRACHDSHDKPLNSISRKDVVGSVRRLLAILATPLDVVPTYKIGELFQG